MVTLAVTMFHFPFSNNPKTLRFCMLTRCVKHGTRFNFRERLTSKLRVNMTSTKKLD